MTSTAHPAPNRSPLEKAKAALDRFTADGDKPAEALESVAQPEAQEDLLFSSPASSKGGTPACRPWDRRDLFKRLRSFRAGSWYGKPESVSSLQCASQGWLNPEPDVLTCEVGPANTAEQPV